jgi:hypothetical protein
MKTVQRREPSEGGEAPEQDLPGADDDSPTALVHSTYGHWTDRMVAIASVSSRPFVEGMPGRVKMLAEVETTRFDGFADFPAWEDPRTDADWLQGLVSAIG